MNPSIYEVTEKNIIDFVDNSKDHEREELFRLAKSMLDNGKHIYASFYRPGSLWGEEVFVCPKCIHATLVGNPSEQADEEYRHEFYCKYCYTDWFHDQNGWHEKEIS